MHELGIIEEIFRLAKAEIDRQQIQGTITQMTLTVGRLSGASPEALRNAFEIVSPSTRLAGAELVIVEPGPICHCDQCGESSEVDGFIFRCPSCESREIRLEGGAQLQLTSLEVDDDDNRE